MKGCCQHTVGAGLASKRLTHQHETMPHYHHLKDLQDFLSKEIGELQVHELAVFLDGLQQDAVVSFWKLDPREEVGGDTLKLKGNVVSEGGILEWNEGTHILFYNNIQWKHTCVPTCTHTYTLRSVG